MPHCPFRVTGPSTSTHDKNLRIAITGSLLVHGLLFMLLAWMFAGDAAHRLWKQSVQPPRERTVTLIFPQQVIAEDKETEKEKAKEEEKKKEKEREKEKEKEPEPQKKKEIPPPPAIPQYIRSTQNTPTAEAPKNPAFISDRNTKAATVLAPSPAASADEKMPTTGGIKTVALELVDREWRNGEVREDTAPAAAKSTPKQPEQMAQPQPPQRPTILKPKDAAPTPTPQQMAQTQPPPPPAQPPAPPAQPQQQPPAPPPQPMAQPQVAAQPPAPLPLPPPEPDAKPQPQAPPLLAQVTPVTMPLSRILDEGEKDLAREGKNRLSIELKKAESATSTPLPQPQDSPPLLPTPVPVPTPAQPMAQPPQQTPPPTPTPPTTTPPAREVAQTPPTTPPEKPTPKALPVMSEPLERPPPGMQDPRSYVPFTRTTRTMSTISNRGDVPSVDAAESPLGRYIRQVEGEIGRVWHANHNWRKDTPPGRVVITFWVTKQGKVEGVVIDDQTHSSLLLNEISLLAIKRAKIPPMPQEVYSELPEFEPNRRRFDMNFNILAQ